MTRGLITAVLATGVFASAGASAEWECNMVPVHVKSRCEEANRIEKACAGLAGDALKTCQQKSMQYGHMQEDCSKLAGDAQKTCELRNRRMSLAAPCSGKTGAEREACAKAAGTAGAVTQ